MFHFKTRLINGSFKSISNRRFLLERKEDRWVEQLGITLSFVALGLRSILQSTVDRGTSKKWLLGIKFNLDLIIPVLIATVSTCSNNSSSHEDSFLSLSLRGKWRIISWIELDPSDKKILAVGIPYVVSPATRPDEPSTGLPYCRGAMWHCACIALTGSSIISCWWRNLSPKIKRNCRSPDEN